MEVDERKKLFSQIKTQMNLKDNIELQKSDRRMQIQVDLMYMKLQNKWQHI